MAATCATSYVKAAPAAAAPAHGSSSINKGREDGRQSHICAVSLAAWVGVAMVTSEPKNTMEPNFTGNFPRVHSAAVEPPLVLLNGIIIFNGADASLACFSSL